MNYRMPPYNAYNRSNIFFLPNPLSIPFHALKSRPLKSSRYSRTRNTAFCSRAITIRSLVGDKDNTQS